MSFGSSRSCQPEPERRQVPDAGRCCSCRWWDGPRSDGWGYCTHTKIGSQCGKYEVAYDAAWAFEQIRMDTGPRFGCIHWEHGGKDLNRIASQTETVGQGA